MRVDINKTFRKGDLVALDFMGVCEYGDSVGFPRQPQADEILEGEVYEVSSTLHRTTDDIRMQHIKLVGVRFYTPHSFRFRLVKSAKPFNKQDWL